MIEIDETALQEYLEQGQPHVCALELTDAVQAAPLIYDSGPEYFDFIFGSRDDALHELMSWCERSSSEYSLQRATGLKTDRGALVGILIALGGVQHNERHKADILTLLKNRAFRERCVDAAPDSRLPRVLDDVYYIRSLSIAPNFRQRGFARALMHVAIKQGNAAGYHKFRLDLNADNLPARRLYESFGFFVISEPSFHPIMRSSWMAMQARIFE
jgi:ribosomal protein S18 acetylase RimI-like enzyme